MARIKVDWSKVEMVGPLPEDLGKLVEMAPADIKPGIDSQAIKVKPSKVQITVGEGDKAKQFGASFLKIDSASDDSVDSILAAIKAAGKAAVIDAHNAIQRDNRVAFLTKNYGDISKTIDDLVQQLVDSGWDATEARELVIAKRTKAGLRVS